MFEISKIKSNTLMFHNFHDSKDFLSTPGSISKKKFENLVKELKNKKFNLINPKTFFLKIKKKNLKKKDILLTFDDGLKCQIKIILPILEKYKIQSIFFIPTFKYFKLNSTLEAKRYFIYTKFKNIKNFYKIYFKRVFLSENKKNNFLKINKKKISNFQKKYLFYSVDDIIFRLIRSKNLQKHNLIMKDIMRKFNFNEKSVAKKLLMDARDYKKLVKSKQHIGLHSDEHITSKAGLTYKKEFQNYFQNKEILNEFYKDINACSYPTNVYTKNSKKILSNIGIDFAFISNDKCLTKYSKYHLPRTDITYLIKK